MNIQFPQNLGIFLSSCTTFRFSRRAQCHEVNHEGADELKRIPIHNLIFIYLLVTGQTPHTSLNTALAIGQNYGIQLPLAHVIFKSYTNVFPHTYLVASVSSDGCQSDAMPAPEWRAETQKSCFDGINHTARKQSVVAASK
jgi:hypothetical protein